VPLGCRQTASIETGYAPLRPESATFRSHLARLQRTSNAGRPDDGETAGRARPNRMDRLPAHPSRRVFSVLRLGQKVLRPGVQTLDLPPPLRCAPQKPDRCRCAHSDVAASRQGRKTASVKAGQIPQRMGRGQRHASCPTGPPLAPSVCASDCACGSGGHGERPRTLFRCERDPALGHWQIGSLSQQVTQSRTAAGRDRR
jgi:hypothetical protein